MSEVRFTINARKGTTIKGQARRRVIEDGRVVLDFLDSNGTRVAYGVLSGDEWATLGSAPAPPPTPEPLPPPPPPPPAPTAKSTNTPPGTPLLTSQQAAAKVRRGPWEPRPENARANQRVPTSAELVGFRTANGNGSKLQAYADRVDGQFTGTTDEIIQWAAWKWGLDEDILRAVCVNESGWNQQTEGDHINGVPYSFGVTQIKRPTGTQWTGWEGTYPLSQISTAFNVDFWGASVRSGVDGHVDWLEEMNPGMDQADVWGWVGAWYSGRWYDEGARNYIGSAKNHMAARRWEQPF